MLYSKTNNILLVIAIAVISLGSLILSIIVFGKCRKCARSSGATKGIKTLKVISAISIPIDAICLLISGTYLIMIFWFMTTRYYNSYGFSGEYYPGGVFLAISPFLISLLGFFFCICAYSKSATTEKTQPTLLAANNAPMLQYSPQPVQPQVQPAARFCTKCGFRQTRQDALFCENCGNKIE